MYEFAKAIHHSLFPGAVPSLCHCQLQGQVAAWGPSGDPSCVGSVGAPHLAVLSRFWVINRLDEPLRSLFPGGSVSHFWCHFSFSNKPTALPQPPGGIMSRLSRGLGGVGGLHSGCCEDPNPFVSTRVMLHNTDPHGSVSIPTCSVRWTFVESLFL